MAASFVLPLSAHAASSSTGSASAQSPAGSSAGVTLTDDELKDRLESLVDQAADFASVSEADKSLYAHRVESEVADRQIALSAISSADLNWADSTVLENNSDVRMVRVPAPQAKGDLSAVMILLGSNNSMSVIEHKFTPVSTTAMRLQLWADGSLKMDKIADSATQTVVDSSAWKPAGDMTAQFSWGKFNDCLAFEGDPLDGRGAPEHCLWCRLCDHPGRRMRGLYLGSGFHFDRHRRILHQDELS
jgi:hypothetical protein